MIAVRVHSNVALDGLYIPPSRMVPVVGSVEPEETAAAGTDLAYLAAQLRCLQSRGVSEQTFRRLLRRSEHYARYVDADFPPARETLTFGEAEALIRLGYAEPVEPDLDAVEDHVARWSLVARGNPGFPREPTP